MTLKEQAVGATLGVIALYAVAVLVWFFYSDSSWKKASRAYDKEKERFAREEKLIGEKQKWTDAYETEKAAMQMFQQGKSTQTHWLSKVEEIAKKHLVAISSIESGDETEADDVFEMQIKARFEASLEAFVKFSHELENSDEGMFDFSYLSMKPNSSKKGYLTGSFALNCAYMREKEK